MEGENSMGEGTFRPGLDKALSLSVVGDFVSEIFENNSFLPHLEIR